MGINPQIDGQIIRLRIPDLTEDRRKDLIKILKNMGEKGKISKFINDNTLLNQIWIMDPKKKVIDILKENNLDKELKILDFVRFKVGEGV